MPPHATALHAGLLALLFLVLSLRVVQARRQHGAALGTPAREVERAVRARANFAEYVPLRLLLFLLEALGAPSRGVHALGTLLLAGRLSHAWGISHEPEVIGWRVLGMALTFAATGLSAAALLVLALAR